MKHEADPKDLRGESARVLSPGLNCGKIAVASRAAALIDAAAYYSALDETIRRAKRSILIVGWDFDARIKLRPDRGENEPQLGVLLRSLVEQQPELEVRVLVWSVAVLHAPGAPLPLLLGAEWEKHPRISVRLDDRHPIYGSHHQKIVCVDDTVAFAGGMDLTIRRWDTDAHRAHEPLRCDPEGNPYCPVHDLQMIVEGEAARNVAAVARARWERAIGETLAPVPPQDDLWPGSLDPDFTNAPTAIACTSPAYDGDEGVQEVECLNTAAIAAAKRILYIEAQYFTAASVGDAIEELLQRPAGPEVVVVVTHFSRGLMERIFMGRNRDRLISRLSAADRHGRLRILYPVVPDGDEDCDVLVHAKLMIVDDTFIRIGSANLNNRSLGLDTECDLAVEAHDAASCRAIAHLRNRLVGEHLDASPDEVRMAVEETGSLIAAIERLNCRARGLRRFPVKPGKQLSPVFGTALLDPREPFRFVPRWLRRAG